MLAICMDGECFGQTKVITSGDSFIITSDTKEILYTVQEIYYPKTISDTKCIALAYKKKTNN